MSQDLIVELRRQNRRLKQLLVVLSISGASCLLLAAKAGVNSQKFTEIDVERINIIMPDGRKEMVLSNRLRIPDPIVGGKEVKREGPSRPGLIFYDEVGNENGGLIYDGNLGKDGKPDAGMHFSMDRHGGDQQLALGHYESAGTMESGLKIFDRGLIQDYGPLWEAYEKAPAGPEKDALLQRWEEAGGKQTTRMFVGKTRGKSSAVILADGKGKPRIMMLVTPEGTPSLKFMDDKGQVIQSLPQESPKLRK